MFSPEGHGMGFAKLSDTLTKSSIWSEKLHVRVVWISFLAEKDEDGLVRGSRSGLIRACNVTPEQYDDAIDVLTSPDPDSQNPENDGRRIEVVPGGVVVLNHAEYRLPEDQKRENTRNRVRAHRQRQKELRDGVTQCNAVKRDVALPSVSVSVSSSASEEGDCQGGEVLAVISLLNDLSHSRFRAATAANARPIRARLDDGHPLEDLLRVVRHKCAQWGNDEKMSKYLRPVTLFRQSNFEGYLSEALRTPTPEDEEAERNRRMDEIVERKLAMEERQREMGLIP